MWIKTDNDANMLCLEGPVAPVHTNMCRMYVRVKTTREKKEGE